MFWKSLVVGTVLVGGLVVGTPRTRFPSNWVVWILCSGHLGVPGGLPE